MERLHEQRRVEPITTLGRTHVFRPSSIRSICKCSTKRQRPMQTRHDKTSFKGGGFVDTLAPPHRPNLRQWHQNTSKKHNFWCFVR